MSVPGNALQTDARMNAPLILAVLAAIFCCAALWRLARDGFKLAPASRTWLLVALIFGAVSAWLGWPGAGPPR